MIRRFALALLLLSSTRAVVLAQSADVPLANWMVPTYRASSAVGGLTTMTDITPPRAFIGIQPCRVADTRGNGAPITGGIFANSEARNWTVWGICGIPSGADAVSVNFSVVSPAGTPAGAFLLAWPTGQAAPPTAIMTYGPGATILSNAAIVPLNASGQMRVNVSHSTHIVMDVNGYFSDTLQNTSNQFEVRSSGGVAIYGENTASGYGVWGNSATGYGVVGGGGTGGVWATTSGSGSGVYGQNTASGYGVHGHSVSGFGVVATTGGSVPNAAVWAQNASTANESSGVYGAATAVNPSGPDPRTWGVFGETRSDAGGSAGVFGRGKEGVPSTVYDAGVRGENRFGAGVLGLTAEDVAGNFVNSHAVHGVVVGVISGIATGTLGYNGLGSTNYGVYSQGPYGGSGAKYFVEPHPTDASKVIRYVSLEGNESGTYFRGRGKFQNGIATIAVPEDFRLVTDTEGLSIVATPIGPMATVSVASIGLETIVLRASRNVEFFYIVNGVRKTHKHLTPIGSGREYMPERPDAKMPLYLTDGQKEMLISNGTYRPDGTVNLETARRLGWDREWEKRGRPDPQPSD